MERGQSSLPVVALLVALLLAALAVLFLAGSPFASVLSDPPQVTVEATQELDAGPNETAATVTFAHEGGDELPAGDVFVRVDGERADSRENLSVRRPSSTFEIGDRVVVEQTGPAGLTGGERLSLVYRRGDTEFTLHTVTVNDVDA